MRNVLSHTNPFHHTLTALATADYPSILVQYSFFYNEYKDSMCFYEFVIMGRKLAFLAISLAFVPELAGADSVETDPAAAARNHPLHHPAGAARALPFKESLMNTLERLTLVTLSIIFQLFSCSLALRGSTRSARDSVTAPARV